MTIFADANILITRPGERGLALCTQIEAAGARAIHLPTIAFAPPTDHHAYARALAQLGDQDWLIFISPQAVTASMAAIRERYPHLPPTLHIAAVGEGTVRVLQAAGIVQVHYPSVHWSSEGLLAMAEFLSPTGKKIMLIRGEGGRPTLADTLTRRGAQVSHCIAYQRTVPDIDMSTYAFIFTPNALQAIVCASYDSVAHLKILCTPEHWEVLRHIPLVVVSERIQFLAQKLGFQTIWVAANASHEAILATLTARIA